MRLHFFNSAVIATSKMDCPLIYDLYSLLDNHKASNHTFQATTFKVEENSRTFRGIAQKFKVFSRENGIQGLFKDFH